MHRTKTQKKALAALNYDLFSPENMVKPAPATLDARIREHTASSRPVELQTPGTDKAGLPSVSELYRMFDMYNWLYFGGKLPRAVIERWDEEQRQWH